MRKLLSILLLLALAVSLSGCTMTQTPAERHRRIVNNWDIQLRQMGDDWDYMWLLDRPPHLSQYHVRTGTTN